MIETCGETQLWLSCEAAFGGSSQRKRSNYKDIIQESLVECLVPVYIHIRPKLVVECACNTEVACMSVPVVYLVRVATWQMICRVNGLWSGVHALTILGIKQNSLA